MPQAREVVGPPPPGRGGRLAPGLRLFDPFALTAQQLHDSVDSIHFGKETNALIVQVMLAAHDNTPRVQATTGVLSSCARCSCWACAALAHRQWWPQCEGERERGRETETERGRERGERERERERERGREGGREGFIIESLVLYLVLSGAACSPTSALIFLINLVIHDVLDQVLLNHFCAPPGDAGI